MKITRKADVVWNGGIKDGKGAITTASGALKSYPYGFSSRFERTAVSLTLRGRVPGATRERFLELAEKAKANCPLSKVIRAPITLKAELA